MTPEKQAEHAWASCTHNRGEPPCRVCVAAAIRDAEATAIEACAALCDRYAAAKFNDHCNGFAWSQTKTEAAVDIAGKIRAKGATF